MSLAQLSFDLLGGEPAGMASPRIAAAVEALATQGGVEVRGAVFTRSEVVDFILDLVGYTEDQPIHRRRLLEPSFGGGEFLMAAVGRLLAAWQHGNTGEPIVETLSNSIRAVELHRDTYTTTRIALLAHLVRSGVGAEDSTALADAWLTQGDFLLAGFDDEFDYVVGNPPYVRQELIPAPLLAEYRARYQTLFDRADLYIPFIERSLMLLNQGGNLGFICADRWMKNKYGGPLRDLVFEKFHLKAYVDMVGTSAFHSEVSAYPAITIIGRERPGSTRVARRPSLARAELISLAAELRSALPPTAGSRVRELARVADGDAPWLLESSDQMALVRRLEQSLPTLEEAACKVGIGVATGADKEFIGDFATLDVEADRKLPLVTTRDIMSGQVQWRGQGVINPFADDGRLVDLASYPRLGRYLEERKEKIADRHCAKKLLANWYRTIDRIDPALAKKPKLLIPDIKGAAHIVYEPGELYPHHNLYHITSDAWDLRALQAVLLSGVARLFVATYSTRMRGGYLRFQAQYLRRIRVPHWRDVPEPLRTALIAAAASHDLTACSRAVFELYALSDDERAALGGGGEAANAP